MQKLKKIIAAFLVISLLSGAGLFNASSIVAYAAEKGIEQETNPFESDLSDPYNLVYYDENGNKVDMDALKAELGGTDSNPGPVSLPASYDARNDNLITAVKNQGNYGTCWAHATMACLEADAIKNGYYTKNNADFSEAHLAWFEKNPIDLINSTSANDGSNNNVVSNSKDTGAFDIGGNTYPAIATLSRTEGIALESDFPYNDVGNHTTNLYSDTQRYDTGSGLIADSMVELKEGREIKQWIIDHGAVFCAYFANSTHTTLSFKGPYYCQSNSINHAVTVVGWDDDYSVNNFKSGNRPSNNGAWLIKNSWGTDFCDNGYFWMSYETTPLYFYGFTVSKSESIKNNYTYNGERADAFEVKVPSNWLTANVFEAKGNEKLTKVSFYTGQRNLDVDIRVYKLEKGYRAPVSGNLVYEESKSYRNAGYHTVDLKNSVELAEGQLFSIVVEYSTSSKGMIIYCENSKGAINYVSNKGESWFGYDGDWIDTSLLSGGFGNNYINAITEQSSGSTSPIEENTGKISASPSNLTIEIGEEKGICVAFSPWKTGKYNVSTDCDEENDIISYDYESLSGTGSVFYNGIAKLNIKGLKPGTSTIKITLLDLTGNDVDTTNVTVTVKEKKDISSQPSIGIKGFGSDYYADYRSYFIFNTKTKNMPADAEVYWIAYVGDDEVIVGEGVSFSCGPETGNFGIQAVIVQDYDIIAESQIVNVHINSGFFARLIAFFRGIFGALPVVEDGRVK